MHWTRLKTLPNLSTGCEEALLVAVRLDLAAYSRERLEERTRERVGCGGLALKCFEVEHQRALRGIWRQAAQNTAQEPVT